MNKFSVDINRHFIFNALNSAVSLIRVNPKTAALVITELCECLQYLSREKPEKVFLKDEFEFVKSYLFIQKVRFQDRIEINYDIDDQLNPMIPAYLLKIIMENIFYHIVSKINSQVQIDISVYKHEKVNIYISITSKQIKFCYINEIFKQIKDEPVCKTCNVIEQAECGKIIITSQDIVLKVLIKL